MYEWRRMSSGERKALLDMRKRQGLPWHRPPFRDSGEGNYLLTASCYLHQPILGKQPDRLMEFSNAVRGVVSEEDTLQA